VTKTIITPAPRLCQLDPQRRLTDAELQLACASFTAPAPFRPSDPYRPIDRRQQVPFYQPLFVRGNREAVE
jgi:hypothetical protein